MRSYKDQLAEVGVMPTAFEHFELEADGANAVKYPCEYPPKIAIDGEVVRHRIYRTRTLPDAIKANPRQPRFSNPEQADLPDGEMPLFYTANYNHLRHAVNMAGGNIFLFEGDKDLWTAFSAGVNNSASILSAGARIDDRLAIQFRDLGVRMVRYYADADQAGWSLAEKLKEVFSRYQIEFVPYHLPYYVNGQRVKDTSDVWLAVQFNVNEYRKILTGSNVLILPSQRHIDMASTSDYFTPALYEDIERTLNIPPASWKSTSEWSIDVKCPKANHEHDDTNPSFHWNRKKRIGRCFKCGQTFLAKDIAEALGINWRNYITRGMETFQPPSIDAVPEEKEKTDIAKPGATLLSSYKLDPVLRSMPVDSYTFTMLDALDDHEQRITGLKTSKYPPIVNPMTVFHRLGGLAHILTRPVMVGFLGRSGGFKSSIMTAIMNRLSLQGYHGIVFSPEWSKQRHADRLIQQFGGIKMHQVSLAERYWYEEQMVKSGQLSEDDPSLFGEIPTDEMLKLNTMALNAARKNLRGEIVYIDKFGASIHDILAMVIETNYEMIKRGVPPSYFLFDYAQLARAPKGFHGDWTPEQTVTEIKALTVELGFATFVSSQVRKSDTIGMLQEGKLLDSTSGKFVNDHEFQFFWTTNPADGYIINKDQRRIREVLLAVTKNSDGSTADTPENAISIYADLDRMSMMDSPNGGDPVFDLIEADLKILEEDEI